jgi:hypothetical protein
LVCVRKNRQRAKNPQWMTVNIGYQKKSSPTTEEWASRKQYVATGSLFLSQAVPAPQIKRAVSSRRGSLHERFWMKVAETANICRIQKLKINCFKNLPLFSQKRHNGLTLLEVLRAGRAMVPGRQFLNDSRCDAKVKKERCPAAMVLRGLFFTSARQIIREHLAIRHIPRQRKFR